MLDDGDQIVLHDDCPDGWRPGDRAALLIHGLAGCHESGYMVRIAHKLHAAGVRAFRMDLRGCGAGAALARLPYHSGRSEDARAALVAIAELAGGSPTTLVGFSLGANIALKLLGELGQAKCGNLDSAMAVCPPIDLAACSRQIARGGNRLYDRHFVHLLLRQLRRRGANCRAPAPYRLPGGRARCGSSTTRSRRWSAASARRKITIARLARRGCWRVSGSRRSCWLHATTR